MTDLVSRNSDSAGLEPSTSAPALPGLPTKTEKSKWPKPKVLPERDFFGATTSFFRLPLFFVLWAMGPSGRLSAWSKKNLSPDAIKEPLSRPEKVLQKVSWPPGWKSLGCLRGGRLIRRKKLPPLKRSRFVDDQVMQTQSKVGAVGTRTQRVFGMAPPFAGGLISRNFGHLCRGFTVSELKSQPE